jgi:F420-non-reducing hydrogenase small subunit
LIAVDKRQFLGSLQSEPELAIAIIKTLILRFTYLEKIVASPGCIQVQRRASWMPVVKQPDRITLSIVTLSTCAGCSAVLLDNTWLSEILAMADIDYCQMLMDEEVLGDSDVILVDGLVRLQDDEKRLQEARRKCRHLVAWGSCAAFAGIPALANRFEVEAVIEESFGATDDAFSYYFSGASGIDRSRTYQRSGIALQRRAFALDSFVKVDYYLPGCPPPPMTLLNLLRELTNRATLKIPPIVCSRCGRKRLKNDEEMAAASNRMDAGPYCFNSLGRLCLGFMTRGGCDPACPRRGAPCWGCRGPSNKTVKALQAGDTMEEIAAAGLRQRCPDKSVRPREAIQQVKLDGHFMFNVHSGDADKLTRVK